MLVTVPKQQQQHCVYVHVHSSVALLPIFDTPSINATQLAPVFAPGVETAKSVCGGGFNPFKNVTRPLRYTQTRTSNPRAFKHVLLAQFVSHPGVCISNSDFSASGVVFDGENRQEKGEEAKLTHFSSPGTKHLPRCNTGGRQASKQQ